MRPTKYKAWHKANKVMYEVSGLAFYNKLCEVFDPEVNDRIRILGFPLEDVILLQYTGLKDKNGREIYEGDILHGHFDIATETVQERGLVVFKNYRWIVEVPNIGDDELIDWSTHARKLKVIGNIYEGKHLLEGESDG